MSLWCTPLGLGHAPLSLGMCLWVWGEQLGFGARILGFGVSSLGLGCAPLSLGRTALGSGILFMVLRLPPFPSSLAQPRVFAALLQYEERCLGVCLSGGDREGNKKK